MDEDQVTARLGAMDDGRWVTGGRVRALAAVSRIYERDGVLSEHQVCSLHRCCPSAESCWSGVRASERPTRTVLGDPDYDRPGSIFWPWVGERYGPGGLCLVGININADDDDWWSVNVEYAITKVVFESLAAGQRKVPEWNSPFGYRSTASAAAILRSLDGEAPTLEYDPTSLVADLERIARVQAIKCSPMRERGTPTEAMWENCPPRFLMPELKALEPGVLLVFGGDARWVLDRHGRVQYTTTGPDYQRGTLQADGHIMDLFVLPHPSAWGGKWARGQAQLIDDLVASPLSRH